MTGNTVKSVTSLTATSGFQKEMIELIDILALSARETRGGEEEWIVLDRGGGEERRREYSVREGRRGMEEERI